MRFIVPASALALALLTVSSVSLGKKPDSVIDARSVALAAQGDTLIGEGKYGEAIDQLETALAVDPKNRTAIILLARAADKQGLPGKAIRLYREALLIEPNDVVALSGQGEALVQKGAMARARENLVKITKICPTNCPEQTKLASVIEKAASTPVVSAEAVKPKPVVTQN